MEPVARIDGKIATIASRMDLATVWVRYTKLGLFGTHEVPKGALLFKSCTLG